jgi:diamine N-acetyltransferase
MITFKKASINEIGLLRQLADNIWKISYNSMLSAEQIEYMLNWMYSPETIEKEINEGIVWEIIYVEEKPAGFLVVTAEKESLKLNKLYIAPGFQGKGIGQEALNYVISYGKNNSFKEVYLTVNKGNAKAIKAYEKAGFVCTDSKIFDIGGGYVMDDFIYSYYL